MARKSRWIETEIEREGEVYFIPIRCCIEVKKNRRRFVIQSRESGIWIPEKITKWVSAPGIHRLSKAQLDGVATTVADLLVDRVETYLDEHEELL